MVAPDVLVERNRSLGADSRFEPSVVGQPFRRQVEGGHRARGLQSNLEMLPCPAGKEIRVIPPRPGKFRAVTSDRISGIRGGGKLRVEQVVRLPGQIAFVVAPDDERLRRSVAILEVQPEPVGPCFSTGALDLTANIDSVLVVVSGEPE